MKNFLLGGAALLLLASAASAQDHGAQDHGAPSFCPSGDVTTIRISKIKPGGSLDGFRKAFDDHKKWYFDHGYARDRFRWGKGLDFDAATRSLKEAPDRVITFHFVTSHVPQDKHDAGWDAYVAEYDRNSEIVSTMVLCLEP